jgi:hypothetical protein
MLLSSAVPGACLERRTVTGRGPCALGGGAHLHAIDASLCGFRRLRWQKEIIS